jgi:general stress protein YciG
MAEKGGMTVREAGRKGGKATKARHGPEFYQSIGRKGGETTKERHGPEFYEKIGRKGGQRVRQLVQQAKRAQARYTLGLVRVAKAARQRWAAFA